MLIKIHDSYRKVVAVCDSELVGKRFEEGKMQLEVKENFFKGDEIGEEKLIEVLRREKDNYATFNIVGEKSVRIALDIGIVEDWNIGKVDGVPFALVLL